VPAAIPRGAGGDVEFDAPLALLRQL
jgi:hypothetical protein